MGEQALAVLVAARLSTIHPNPGPSRHRTPEAKAARREKRKERRREKREQRAKEDEKGEVVVAAWNVQRMSLKERGRRKAKVCGGVCEEAGLGRGAAVGVVGGG